MPSLDVSWVTADPMLADVFNVIRRREVPDGKGRMVPTPEERFNGIVGVVTQQDPAELLRRDDQQLVPRRIFIASAFQFRNASRDAQGSYQPDQIEWNGSVYTIEQVYPYGRFGSGMWECVAGSQVAMDVPQ